MSYQDRIKQGDSKLTRIKSLQAGIRGMAAIENNYDTLIKERDMNIQQQRAQIKRNEASIDENQNRINYLMHELNEIKTLYVTMQQMIIDKEREQDTLSASESTAIIFPTSAAAERLRKQESLRNLNGKCTTLFWHS